MTAPKNPKPTPEAPSEAMVLRTSHPSLLSALVGALEDMPAITQGNTANVPTKAGGSYSYTYADLADVLDAVRPVLARHGLGVVQNVTNAERGSVHVVTTLVWDGGETMDFGPLSMPSGGDPQGTGSAITYARRYALLAALGIATEDDDGAAAQHSTRERQAPQPARQAPQPAPPAPLSPRPDLDAIRAAMDAQALSPDTRAAVVAALAEREVPHLRDLSLEESAKVLAGLLAMGDLLADVDTVEEDHDDGQGSGY